MNYKLKNFLYFVCLGIFYTLIYSYMYMYVDTNNQGEFCNYNSWQADSFFQGISGEKPCFFTTDFYVAFFVFVMWLYLVFDQIRRKIVGKNPLFVQRAMEIGGLFLFVWMMLLYNTYEAVGLNISLVYGSFMGTLLYILPCFALVWGVQKLSGKIVGGIAVGMFLLYVLIIAISFIW